MAKLTMALTLALLAGCEAKPSTTHYLPPPHSVADCKFKYLNAPSGSSVTIVDYAEACMAAKGFAPLPGLPGCSGFDGSLRETCYTAISN